MASSQAESDCTVYDHENDSTVDNKDPEGDAGAKGDPAANERYSNGKAEGIVYEEDVEKDASTDHKVTVTAILTPAAADADPNIVDWDGPNDPANPRNWSPAWKRTNVILVTLSVLYASLATTMYAPAANIMKSEFGYGNDTVETLTITIASLGFAMGQLFCGPCSEVFGRVAVYRTSAIFYLGFTAGCAQSTNVAEFLVFRLLTGIAASSFMSTGGGTIADVLPVEQRGAAMALYTSGPLFGPVRCPVRASPCDQQTDAETRSSDPS